MYRGSIIRQQTADSRQQTADSRYLSSDYTYKIKTMERPAKEFIGSHLSL